MSKIIDGIVQNLKAIPETLKAKIGSLDKKKIILVIYNEITLKEKLLQVFFICCRSLSMNYSLGKL